MRVSCGGPAAPGKPGSSSSAPRKSAEPVRSPVACRRIERSGAPAFYGVRFRGLPTCYPPPSHESGGWFDLARPFRYLEGAMSATNLLELTPDEIVEFVEGLGEPAYRGRQLATWVYVKGIAEFGAMSNLPRELRERLAAVAVVAPPELV